MKSFIASSIIALLASTAVAAPAGATAQVALSNDQTGANGNAIVPLDGVARPVISLYAGTNVVKNGQVLVSSTMLTGGIAFNPTCVFSSANGTPVTTLNATQTFKKLGNNPNMLQIVDWTAFTLKCSA